MADGEHGGICQLCGRRGTDLWEIETEVNGKVENTMLAHGPCAAKRATVIVKQTNGMDVDDLPDELVYEQPSLTDRVRSLFSRLTDGGDDDA